MSNRVLFYYPSNKRSVQIETQLEELSKQKIEFILLTTCEQGDLHKALNELEIKTFAYPIKKTFALIYYLKQIIFL